MQAPLPVSPRLIERGACAQAKTARVRVTCLYMSIEGRIDCKTDSNQLPKRSRSLLLAEDTVVNY